VASAATRAGKVASGLSNGVFARIPADDGAGRHEGHGKPGGPGGEGELD
jgi:hypothetical protein